MATPNPLGDPHSSSPPPVSAKTFHIAGILTTVHGLEEISPSCKSVACLWLHNPRLKTKEDMAGVAASCINDWNRREVTGSKVGLIAVAFDQRNHGTREVNALANQSWRDGNETHAQDMFSIYHGTALDTTLLMDHLGSYIFLEPSAPSIDQHLVLGISLGGHSAWQVLFNEPRVTAGVVIIGCPDYLRLMTDRARLSKLPTYSPTSPSTFPGSPSFPPSLLSALTKSDPTSLLFSSPIHPIPSIPSPPLSLPQKSHIAPLLTSKICHKRILVCSGGADKLVPYSCSEPFMDFLKDAVGGWWKEGGVHLEDIVYEGVGHEYSEGMKRDVGRFIGEVLVGGEGGDRMVAKL